MAETADRDAGTLAPRPPTSVLVVAAGAGTRMRSATRKPFLELRGQPILMHTLDRFRGLGFVREVIVVVAASEIAAIEEQWGDALRERGVTRLVAGGEERVDSVLQGVEACAATGGDLIAIHDGVRPFVTPAQVTAVCRVASGAAPAPKPAGPLGGAILAVPVRDTLKSALPSDVDDDDAAAWIERTVSRESLWAAQTPQVFQADALREAFRLWQAAPQAVTDDAALLENAGYAVALVPGASANVKITTPDDLPLAEFLAVHMSFDKP